MARKGRMHHAGEEKEPPPRFGPRERGLVPAPHSHGARRGFRKLSFKRGRKRPL